MAEKSQKFYENTGGLYILRQWGHFGGVSEEFEVRPSKLVMTSFRFNLPETVERRVPDSPCEPVLVIAAFYNPSQTYRVENSPVVFVLFQGLCYRKGA